MLKVDLHIHSIVSGHCANTILEIIDFSKKNKMTHIGITEHGPSMSGAPTSGYFWLYGRLPRKFGNLRVYFGCEANIISPKGKLDLDREDLKNQDIVIAGLHSKTPYPEGRGADANTVAMVGAIESGLIDIVSHPIRPEFPIRIEKVVAAAAEHDAVLELNTPKLRDLVGTSYIRDYQRMIKLAEEYGVSMVINSDAHAIWDIGDDFVVKKMDKILRVPQELLLNNNPERISKFSEKRGRTLKED